MIDTGKVKFTGRLLAQLPPRRQVKFPNGVRFWHDGEGNCKADVELPKLLWGHNGCLLADQADLDRSVALFRESLASVVEFESWQWVLVDLCWQFRARAADVIRAHQWSTFAGIRNLPSLICGGKEISWRGAKSRRALKMYDKNLRARGEADGVLRVELRLAGPKLREKIDVSVGLNFGELYQIFRTEVVKLAPVTLPEPRKHSFADLAAGLPLEIRSQFLLGYRQGKTSRAVRGFERKIGSACLRQIGWNWSEKLPVGHPPELINVESKRRQTQGHFPCPLAVFRTILLIDPITLNSTNRLCLQGQTTMPPLAPTSRFRPI